MIRAGGRRARGSAVRRGVLPCGVRAAERADIDRIMEIEIASFAAPWPREAFAAEMSARARSRVRVAVEGGEVLGFMVYWIVEDEVHLLNFAVEPSSRRRGVGRAMMEHLLEDASRRGTRCAYLEVRESNGAARRLYEAFGFELEGVRRGYYSDNGEDALVMAREIRRSAKGLA